MREERPHPRTAPKVFIIKPRIKKVGSRWTLYDKHGMIHTRTDSFEDLTTRKLHRPL